jgi:hypothetical protein
MSHQLQAGRKVIRVMNGVAAGTSDQTSSAVDMFDGGRCWRNCEFIALFGTATTTHVTKMKAQQSSDDAAADAYDDLAGSLTAAMGDTDSNKLGRLEVNEPKKRWLKCIIDRGTANIVIDGMIAVLSNPRFPKTTEDSTVSVTKSLQAPAEGTA